MRGQTQKTMAYVYLCIAAVTVALIGIFVQLIGSDVPPMVLNFYRIFFGTLTLAIICPMVDRHTFRIAKKDLPIYIFIGFTVAVSMSLTNIAFQNAPVPNVAFIMSLTPVFVMFFAYYILHEKITWPKIIALGIAIVGLAVLNPFQAEGATGNLLALIVALLDGILIALLRKEDATHTIGDAFWFLLFAAAFLLPFPVIQGFGGVSWTLVLFGAVTAGLQFFFLNLGLEKVKAGVSSILGIIITPIIATVLAIVVLDEQLNTRVVIGGVILIIAGVYLEQRQLKARKKNSVSAQRSVSSLTAGRS